jgi:hypothetical protein
MLRRTKWCNATSQRRLEQMRISERLIENTADARERASAYAHRALDMARIGAGRAAGRLQAAEKPVETLADAARQLNTLSHRYVALMVDQGATSVRGLLDEGAQRLRIAADAGDLKSAYREQLERTSASRARIVKSARATFGIVAEAGRELQALALTTYAQLVRPQAATKPTRPTRATRTTKKKRARRAA